VSYLRRSRTKSRLFSVGIILLVIFGILIGCNLVLNLQKEKISQASAKYFTQKLSVDNLLFLPPNYFFFKNVTFSENGSAGASRILTLPLIMVKFSLPKFLSKGKVTITDICIYDPQGEYAVLRDFVKNNFKAIWKFFLDLPRQDIRIMVKGARVDLAQENGGPGFVSSYFFLKIKNNGFFGYGSASRNLQDKFPGIPVEYVFKGNLDKDGASFDNIEVMRENIYAKLWGSIHGAVLRLNGFSFLNTTFKEYAYYEPFLNLKERAENFLRGFPEPPKTVEMPKVDLFILDMETQIVFNLPEIQIQRMKFALNNNPMSLSGKIVVSQDKPILLDLKYSTSFSQLKNWTAESNSLKQIDLDLKGAFKDKIFTGSSNISFDFLKRKTGNLPLEEFTAGLEDLIFSFQNYPQVTASVRNASIFCRTDSADYNVGLQYLGMAIDLKNPKGKFCEFNSRFYDGKLKGRVWFDMSQVPPRITSYLRIKNATANKMENILEHFSKVHGKLSGQMRFRNFPALNLKGGLIISQGYIENFEFLKWLSGFFNLNSLKKIEFARATSNFSVDPEGAGLKDLHLASSNLAMAGAFHLGTNNMVASKLALTCNRGLLENSTKFKPLMRLVGKDVAALTFEFRLSGNLHGMNFLWLESDFKHKLREAIPGFMERSVEKKIEESLQSLAQ
jgi:hypothetical protein